MMPAKLCRSTRVKKGERGHGSGVAVGLAQSFDENIESYKKGIRKSRETMANLEKSLNEPKPNRNQTARMLGNTLQAINAHDIEIKSLDLARVSSAACCHA